MKIKSFRPQIFRPSEQKFPTGNALKLIPLGGVGDVTKNMYVYEYQNDIVIIDCGVGFPDEGMPGIDLVIPDIGYLKDKRHKIKGILITHAHDDHIGGLPYIWPELGAPIYSQKLTCGLIKAKFTEHNLPKDQVKTVGLNDQLRLGVFNISFYQVSHSIPDSTGIVLQTPVGTIIHQADFKMDWTPVNGQVTDVGTVASLGKQGVLLMALDCLRIEKSGYNLSEKTIEDTFAAVEKETKGKMLVTMTSSNLTRVQQAINVALKSNRRIVLSGRSVEGNFQVARDLGYLEVPPHLIVAQEEMKRFPDHRLLVLIAGSQGQPGSALSRVANNDHKFVHLTKDDTVVFSADPIPSTESAQHALIDTITKLGCNVYYKEVSDLLHVSGHASQEELKLMVNLAKPKYILPIGGTFRHMKLFSKVCQNLGYQENQILMVSDGSVIEVGKEVVRPVGKVAVSNIYIDGLGVGDVGKVILRDRQVMSEEGIVIVVVPIDQQTGRLTGEPDIVSRGFVFGEHFEDLLDAAKEIVKSVLQDKSNQPLDIRYIRHQIEEHLEKFFYEETKRRPLILTTVVEV